MFLNIKNTGTINHYIHKRTTSFSVYDSMTYKTNLLQNFKLFKNKKWTNIPYINVTESLFELFWNAIFWYIFIILLYGVYYYLSYYINDVVKISGRKKQVLYVVNILHEKYFCLLYTVLSSYHCGYT